MKNCNVKFLTLDIETSALMGQVKDKNGDIIEHPLAVWLSYGVLKEFTYKGETIQTFRFREWGELIHKLCQISQDLSNFQEICYVHNLGYEFDFLIKNVSKPKTFLTNSSHSTISSVLELFPNIQLRCSYLLTGYSLEKLGMSIGLPKLESEYRTIYPDDDVTEEEWFYCERDNDIVGKYIADVAIKEFGKLFSIPYTKTGRVRKIFKSYYDNYKNPTWDSMPSENCIYAMDKAFNGGVVISNPYFTNIKLYKVHSYDITSSYPFVIASENFPRKIKKYENPPQKLLNGDWYIAKIRFKNIQTKYPWQWLSISKMENFVDCKFFNGKLIEGKSCDRYVTNVDFELIEKTYTFDYEIVEYYQLYDVGKLPDCFIDTLIAVGVKKQKLKMELSKYEEGTQQFSEIAIDYNLAKNDFNSIYGMMVEKLIKPIYEIDENFLWHVKEGKYVYKEHMKRNFLFGVFITAFARKNLINAILHNCPYTFVYADTDSIKFIGENVFHDTNKQLPYEIAKIPELATLGRFDYEGTYDEFKTLGAKKYCYKKNGKIVLTVAGLPKSTEYNIEDVDDFKCGVKYKNCKLGKSYLTQSNYYILDEENEVECLGDINVADFLTENNIDTNGGVGLYPTSYLLDMTDTDKFLLKEYGGMREEWLKDVQQKIGTQLNV